MAIIAKLIVERTEKPIRNKHFFGEVKKSQKWMVPHLVNRS